MILFRHIYDLWYFSEAFPKFVWHISGRVLNLTDFWHITDTFQIDFWHFFVTDRFLTVFRQISDSFLKFVGPTLIKSTHSWMYLGANLTRTVTCGSLLAEFFQRVKEINVSKPIRPYPRTLWPAVPRVGCWTLKAHSVSPLFYGRH